ncbi:MAG TPA: pilin [Patescibacteria group bacterium]|nr:pilin [Patescibacteria group bacterium]
MTNKKKKIIILLAAITFLTIPVTYLGGTTYDDCYNICGDTYRGVENILNCQRQCDKDSDKVVALDNPLGSNTLTGIDLYSRLIYAFMGIAGVVALLMFIIGGFQWMTAGGNAEKVKQGRDTLLWAIMGLVVIFSSYAILRAVFETLKF